MILYNEGVDDKSIRDLETFLGVSIPTDYYDFLNKSDGCQPHDGNYISFEIENVTDDLLLGRLYGVDDIKNKRVEYLADLPNEAFIIGEEYGSGFLVLVSGVGDKDGIYFWDLTMFLESSTEEDSSYRISDSFFGFMNRLVLLD